MALLADMGDKGSPGGLHIITPPHLKRAVVVDDPIGIIPEALDILSGIQQKGFVFPGSPYKDCFAIAQPQVSGTPLRYFVLNDSPEFKKVAKEFEGLVIVNPKVEYVSKLTKYMFRDGCMSYPFGDAKKVKRYDQIVVSYDIIKNVKGGILKKPFVKQLTSKLLTGYAALVFQHELEHLDGKSIYS